MTDYNEWMNKQLYQRSCHLAHYMVIQYTEIRQHYTIQQHLEQHAFPSTSTQIVLKGTCKDSCYLVE